MAKMTAKMFQRYLDRDGSSFEGGILDDTLVPNHRVNRGHGGSALLERPSNVVTMGSLRNGLIESDSAVAELARIHGWKLDRWQDPQKCPAFHAGKGWVILDDEFGSTPAPRETVDAWLTDRWAERWR